MSGSNNIVDVLMRNRITCINVQNGVSVMRITLKLLTISCRLLVKDDEIRLSFFSIV